MFTAALVTIAKTSEQPVSTDRLMDKENVYNNAYYTYFIVYILCMYICDNTYYLYIYYYIYIGSR